jgi:hypothetical protein
MTVTRDSNVGILLMRCGDYLVGVDPASVRSIRPAEERDQLLLDIGTFLQSSAMADARDDRPRVVELEHAGAQLMRIDHALGTRLLRIADVVPLGPTFAKHDAPPWWLGTSEVDGEIVLLIDLVTLAQAAEQPL